ncbi:MAG: PPC domain-containing protein [Gemmataceae bacterium]|nr:PPC domain-containing protein [Gemmataceae bacterium]
MVTHTTPVAVQRGTTTEVLVEGQQDFQGAYKALIEGNGISAEVFPQAPSKAPPKGKGKLPQPALVRSVKLKLTVVPDAALGVREFRLASPLGISSIGQLVVVAEPVVKETSVNDTPTQAQGIKLPCVVAGKLEKVEDVDFYKFEARAGETLAFEVFCARLQDKIHDLQKHAKPMLTLYDSEGRELAANDHFYFADPLLTYTVPKTGTYHVQVRESTYDGDQRWVYALLATNRPYASHVYPMAANPGQMIEVEPVGPAKAHAPRVKLQAPKEPGIHQVQLDVNGGKTNPVTFLVSALPQAMEQEPNDDPAQATRITLPCGINGRIEKRRDMDHFVFAAKKGQPLRFEVKARRFGTLLNSSLHAILEVLDRKGKVLARNDDSHGKEAALVFTPAADGDLVLRVRDLNSKGSESAVYHVEADFDRPDFSLRCDPDKAMIGPGSSAAWYVHVNRTGGFAGPVKVEVKGLPPDVTASPLTIPPTMTQGLMVLTAGPNAPLGAWNVGIVGSATVKGETLVRTGTPAQEIYFPGGGRGLFDVSLQTVAVTRPSDILKVEVSTTKIDLKPGQEVKIDVTVHRRKDYDKGLSLDIVLAHLNRVFGNTLPPGVTIVPGKSKTLLGTTSKGHITLKAAPNAEPIEDVPVSVLAHVSINFVVKVSYSSPPILVSVRKQ